MLFGILSQGVQHTAPVQEGCGLHWAIIIALVATVKALAWVAWKKDRELTVQLSARAERAERRLAILEGQYETKHGE